MKLERSNIWNFCCTHWRPIKHWVQFLVTGGFDKWSLNAYVIVKQGISGLPMGTYRIIRHDKERALLLLREVSCGERRKMTPEVLEDMMKVDKADLSQRVD